MVIAGEERPTATIKGITTAMGEEVPADKVIITTGTFLRGVILLGTDKYAAGRHLRDSPETEAPSVGLAVTLEEKLRFPLSRLKTGTPPRLKRDTINWDILETQGSDIPAEPFSYMNIDRVKIASDKFIDCAKSYTNERAHALCREYEHLLPDYDGGVGKGIDVTVLLST